MVCVADLGVCVPVIEPWAAHSTCMRGARERERDTMDGIISNHRIPSYIAAYPRRLGIP